MPSRLGHPVILPQLHYFSHRHPDIHLQLNSSAALTDLIEQGIECVVRVGELDTRSLVARFISTLVMVNYASPQY